MKITKYFMAIALVAASAAFTSCDTDNVGAHYQPEAQNVTFLTSSQAQTTSESDVVVSVRIARANTAGSYTANIAFEGCENCELVGGNAITFADGQGYVDVNVKFFNMERGYTYNAALTLSEADQATADATLDNQVISVALAVTCDYTWTAIKGCSFSSIAFSEDGVTPAVGEVDVDKAAEGEIYRVHEPYDTGCNITFKVDGTNVTVDAQKAWLYDSDYGYVYVKGNGTKQGNKLVTSLHHFLPSIDYDFGAFEEILILPEE